LKSDTGEDEEGYWDKAEASFDDEEPEMTTKASSSQEFFSSAPRIKA
jgi:hypothetical protein